MDYLAVSELKRSRSLWPRLSASRELILTRDGKPGALMVEVSPENLDLAAEIEREIQAARVRFA